MKNISFITLMYCLLSFSAWGQDVQWRLGGEYENDNIESWDVSPLSEVIVSSKGTLIKLDQNFETVFTQGQKRFGNITQIDAKHSMKYLVFSENQQMLGVLDNTLTFQDGMIDLSSLSIDFATHVCYSDQSKRFWIYDDSDARLIRISGFRGSKIQTEISNLSSLLGVFGPYSMRESHHQLFLFYQKEAVFIFDYFGSLVQKYELPNAINIQPTERYIYVLEEDKIRRIDRETHDEKFMSLPLEEIIDFRVKGRKVYFQSKKGIKKYNLILSD